MLKVKLSRIGKKNQPQYRVVVAEAKSKRDGAHTDRIGYYNPLTNPATFTVDMNKYNDWITKGAQPTNTVRLLIKKLSTPKKKKSPTKKKKPTKKPTTKNQ